ncbi:hypothetical protein EJ08DRAFT_593014 [Tothia fuscella]|uniref:DUF7729 domain-containing protein n=1 Tax=Tothia fuscella TaxID=1048955 RepID=A0A9P4NLM1_9PEZI|nr:hypothetical protein EJ08DRAFT_593014 [Tothia fuscella]
MKRDAKASSSSDVPSATFTLVTATGSGGSGGAAAAATASVATASPKSTSLPQPFDTTIGSNFTTGSGCPKFFNFLSDAQFQQCYPFSLLLQTSHQFFEAQKSYVRTTIALDAGCNANFAKCNTYLSGLASKLLLKENCAADYAAQNPIVLQAYTGLITYQPMYQAGCLKDAKGSYCFASAITMTNSSLSDAYPYYLPLGTDMPVGVRPTCGSCLRNTMSIFQSAASNTTQPASRTYMTAAEQVNVACGPDYVRASIDFKASGAGGLRTNLSPWLAILVVFFAVLS